MGKECPICKLEKKEFISGLLGENGLIEFVLTIDGKSIDGASICIECYNNSGIKSKIEEMKRKGLIKTRNAT